MARISIPLLLLAFFSSFAAPHSLHGEESPAEIALWPGDAPDDQPLAEPERDSTKPTDQKIAGKPVIRLGNVSRPTIAVYPAPPDKATGAAVLVCPGGGYHILALDLEGTEVCEWLNSQGVTAVLLKYRVPKRTGREKHAAALQDAQRAVGLIRQHAAEWKIDPSKIGVLGFSAGAHLSASLCTHADKRSYDPLDDADKLDCRPNFALLIYPGYLSDKQRPGQVAADLPLSSDIPPTFLSMTQDDPVGVESALDYATALNKLKVPFELHIYPTGGHGYGLRRTDQAATTWPDRAADWLRAKGWSKPAK